MVKRKKPREGKLTAGNQRDMGVTGQHKLTRSHAALVVRWLGEYRSTPWIIEQLRVRFKIKRKPDTIDLLYRYNVRYADKIAEWRERYNNSFKDEAFASRRFTLQCLKEAYDIAHKQEDAKAMVAVIKQACEMMGHNTPMEIEINHSGNEWGSWEEMFSKIEAHENSQALNATVLDEDALHDLPLLSNPDTLDTPSSDPIN